MILDPAGEQQVLKPREVIAVVMRDEERVEIAAVHTCLDQPERSCSAGVELQGEVAVAHEHSSAGPARLQVGHSRAGDDDVGHEGRSSRVRKERITSPTSRPHRRSCAAQSPQPSAIAANFAQKRSP